MATFGFDNIPFCPENFDDIGNLIWEEVVNRPEYRSIHNIYNNVVTKTTVAYIQGGGDIGVLNQGCNCDPQDYDIPTRSVEFDPIEWEVLFEICWTQFRDTLAVYALKKGKDIWDIEGTEIEDLINRSLVDSFYKFIWRMTWFNDTDKDEVPTGKNIEHINFNDGLWKQIYIQVDATEAAQYVNVPQNDNAANPGQDITSEQIKGILEEMWRKLPIEEKEQEDLLFLMMQRDYDIYTDLLSDVCCLETTYNNFVNGVANVKFKGQPLLPVPIWDKLNVEWETEADGSLFRPHRFLLIPKKYLGVAFDDYEIFGQTNLFRNRKCRKIEIESMGKFDTKIMKPNGFVAAY